MFSILLGANVDDSRYR